MPSPGLQNVLRSRAEVEVGTEPVSCLNCPRQAGPASDLALGLGVCVLGRGGLLPVCVCACRGDGNPAALPHGEGVAPSGGLERQ